MPTKTKKSRPTSITHKKRRGDHHVQGKHYLKVYWPYVPMLLIVLVGLFFGTPKENRQHGVLAYASEMSSQQLLNATNAQRSSNDKKALTINPKLTSAAQAKAKDMATRNYWSHTTPDGKAPWSFVESSGYSYQKAGENLAYGFATSNDTVTGWMNSQTHRDNLLDASFSEVGFGFVDAESYNNSGRETIVVAMYGAPQGAATVTGNTDDTASHLQGDTAIPASNNSSSATLAEQTKSVTVLQSLTGGSTPWIAFFVGLVSGIALLFVTVKHGLAFKKVLVQGEQFMLHHPLLDIGLVGLVMISYVLSQNTGFIR